MIKEIQEINSLLQLIRFNDMEKEPNTLVEILGLHYSVIEVLTVNEILQFRCSDMNDDRLYRFYTSEAFAKDFLERLKAFKHNHGLLP